MTGTKAAVLVDSLSDFDAVALWLPRNMKIKCLLIRGKMLTLQSLSGITPLAPRVMGN